VNTKGRQTRKEGRDGEYRPAFLLKFLRNILKRNLQNICIPNERIIMYHIKKEIKI
jgi:hypothetical protein